MTDLRNHLQPLGLALYGDPWIEQMAEALGYHTSTVLRWHKKQRKMCRRSERDILKLARKHKRRLPKELRQQLRIIE